MKHEFHIDNEKHSLNRTTRTPPTFEFSTESSTALISSALKRFHLVRHYGPSFDWVGIY